MKKHQKPDFDFEFKYNSTFELLLKRALDNKDKEFIISIHKNETERLTYGKFLSKVIVVANYFNNLQLKKGSRICLIMPNSADLLILEYAAFCKGLTVVPINYNLSSEEINYIINDSHPKIIIYDLEFKNKIDLLKLNPENDHQKKFITRYNNNDDSNIFNVYKDINTLNTYDIEINSNLDDEALIIYTSGTSGKPKGCILTHRNMLADGQAIAEWFEFNNDTRTLCLLPLFHNNGQIPTFLAPLWAGGSTIFSRDEISFFSFWDLVNEYSATWTSVIPTILSVLLSLQYERKDNTMKGIICGGALLPRTVQEEFESRFGIPIYEGYGLTETTSFATFNPLKIEERKIGSIGKTLPVNMVGIFDENFNELPVGEVGEICIKGYNVFSEYNNLPENTNQAFRNDWFHSGDFGYKDSDGFFYFRGRKDDLIIRGGENIYPREIENVVYMYPNVKDCVVIGGPHKIMGEELILFVETVDNKPIDKQSLIDFCSEHIAKYKIPSKIYITYELEGLKHIPKGPTNKILRKEVKKYYIENILKDK
ncbi:MAG: acyl--CoA ligase [Candidatus Kapabacteria bacterium]|nr:acyl--CoA ligase [Candidatus Kapabacteria bacterium]